MLRASPGHWGGWWGGGLARVAIASGLAVRWGLLCVLDCQPLLDGLKRGGRQAGVQPAAEDGRQGSRKMKRRAADLSGDGPETSHRKRPPWSLQRPPRPL